jgi:urease accessory protein
MKQGVRSLFALLFGLVAAGAAHAHTGVHADGGFTTGLAHPFLGLDHLLAMVAVGIWAAQLGGRSLLALPAAFVIFMAAGAALGAAGVPLPHVEGMVAVSVLALGCVVGLSARLAWQWAIPLVAGFALFHGHAHGAEMPGFATPSLYFIGFALATGLLHAIGVAGAAALKRHPAVVRAGGAAIAFAGALLLLSV